MRVGLLRETKVMEFRVALLPDSVRVLVEDGNEVWVQARAGEGSRIPDEAYRAAGARLVEDPEELIAAVDLVTKVKEPTPREIDAMRPGQMVYSYLHLAPDPELTRRMLERELIGIAFETVQTDDGTLPILIPMSDVAGRLAVQVGAHYLQRDQGGAGVLLGGVPGVDRGNVTILGAGVVGTAAVRVAFGLGADVTVLDVNHRRLSYLYDIYHGEIHTLFSNRANIERAALDADVLVGAVLIAGARTPALVPHKLVSRMKPGSVIVDVAVDQGGCVETIHPTTHAEPTYVVDDVIHYGVANMPGAVPRTSTLALANATFPYLQEICARGLPEALRADPSLARGVNCWRGQITHARVAEALGMRTVEAPWLRGVAS